MSTWKIHEGDVLKMLRTMPDASFDACLCDPPYGINFMGRAWDRGVPSADVWCEVLRVLKPGAPIMAFGGTRMFHRLGCAIEDAGAEIRDSIAWLYGSGFPKSLDVSKAIDGAAGAVREVVGQKWADKYPNGPGGNSFSVGQDADGKRTAANTVLTAPATESARAWSGYGTALKPAHEDIVLAYKPLDLRGHVHAIARQIQEATCQLASLARNAGSLSASNRDALAPLDSALWPAVQQCSSPAGLFALMATSLSGSERPSSLSIVWSWLVTLAEVLDRESTYTTETTTSLTTDLRTLNCSPSRITPESIIEASMHPRGMTSNASLVESLFGAVASRLAIIRASSAAGPATSPAGALDLRPDFEPIILARKPLEGTVAANVAKWGVGGLAIDASRIGRVEGDRTEYGRDTVLPPNDSVALGHFKEISPYAPHDAGRWPANVILDEAAGDLVDAQSGDRPGMSGGGKHREGYGGGMFGGIDSTSTARGDSGGASRFFYTAKASREEREFGCDGLPMRAVEETVLREEGSAGAESPRAGANRKTGARNHHPTLKPIDLTRYLARLVLPPPRCGVPRRILVPYAGAGSEMIGCLRAGWDDIVGIELEAEYAAIARARLTRWAEVPPNVDPLEVKRDVVDARQVGLFDRTGT